MTRRSRWFLGIIGGLAALVVVAVISILIVAQTAWFSNFVKEKIVSSVEESTGGRVEVGSFQFDLWHLTVRIRNFVLHGTEPKAAAPLARVALLELQAHLLSSFAKPFTIRYLGLDSPQLNVIVSADGKTNIPEPRVKSKPSSDANSGLETVVNLAIGDFRLQNGLIQFAQKKSAFEARGQNLRLLMNYDTAHPGYEGNLTVDPLLLQSAGAPPLNVHVALPLKIGKDNLQIEGARIYTDQSQIQLTASVVNLNAPDIRSRISASISLPEFGSAFNLPIDTASRRSPKLLTADAQVEATGNNIIRVTKANVGLGETRIEASGALNPGTNDSVTFHSNFDLSQLASLLKVNSIKASGRLRANGSARLDRKGAYSVDGRAFSEGISVQSGKTKISDITLTSPFHADPYLISLDGLKFGALGGSVAAKVFIENLARLSAEAKLNNFSLAVIGPALAGHLLGYDSTLSGTVKAQADLKAKGTSGDRADIALALVSGTRGVPLSGRIKANYLGSNDSINVQQSYLSLPHSRLDLSGAINRRLNLVLTSHDLNDFLPAANFGSAKPMSSLPVTLVGGMAKIDADVQGNLSAPRVNSTVSMTRFAIGADRSHPLDRFGLDVHASPSHVAVQNGVLAGQGLQSSFDAALGLRKFSPQPNSPLSVNWTLRNGNLHDLLALAAESSLPATGNLAGDVHLTGTFADPIGQAQLALVNASAYDQPIDRVALQVNLADQLITLNDFDITAAGGTLRATASFRHPRSSFSSGHLEAQVNTDGIQLRNFRALQERSPGVAGAVRLAANLSGDLQSIRGESAFNLGNVVADLSARGLQLNNQDAGNLTLSARTAQKTVNYVLNSNFAGSAIHVDGSSTLAGDYPTVASAQIQNLPVEKVLAIAGQASVPASGLLNANARLAGSVKSPDANLSFALSKASVYEEPIDRFSGSVHYTDSLVDISDLRLDVPAGNISLAGRFSHAADSYKQGDVQLRVTSSDVAIAKIRHAVAAKPGLAGTVRLSADLAGRLREVNNKPALLFSHLNADASAQGLRIAQQQIGQVNLQADTTGQLLNFKIDSDLAKAQIHGSGTSNLSGDYNTNAKISFTNIRYANIAPLLAEENAEPPGFDALVEGQASVNGPALNLDLLQARLELARLDVHTVPKGSPTGAPPTRTVDFHNEGPIVVALDHSAIDIAHFDIEGPRTSIKASGGLNLKNNRSPLSLNLAADADLKVLQDTNRDFFSSGSLSLRTVVRGTTSSPLINGKVELKNANVNYAESPNGLSNANGVILLNGTNATIENLSAESGGGKVNVSGFAGLTGRSVTFNLKAALNRVRVRTSGVSVTSDAEVTLTGNDRRSLANGQITIRKIAYGASSDAGSFLSTVGTPPSTPSAPTPFLSGMRLDIRIVTAPDLRVVTTYADRLAMEANLAVRGTAATPGMIGRISVTDGQLVFFGNQYTVNTGIINFYNPTAIQPILNVSLETIAQNVDVVLGVTGPINNLQLSYRSDPPLTFQQIVQLLATNTTPNDPTIAARQPQPAQQSLAQMGSSAILGQAVANPLASRVQRVFGLSAFKIDPSVAGTNGQPTAKVTLQQKIASNITFTYITDVTQTNSQIIRIEWALTPKLSAVGLRDFNGNVSIQFFYKFKLR